MAISRFTPIVSVLSFVLLSLAPASPARAALGGTDGVVIPYAGKLELDGVLVTGSVDLKFDVMVDASTATVCDSKTISPVPVTNGEFAVTIPGVLEACVKGRDVHLNIAVRQPSGTGAFVALGKQRVTPVLSAVTSGAGDFAVTGALTAATAAVTGTLTAPTLQNPAGDVTLGAAGQGNVVVNAPLRTPGGFMGAKVNIMSTPGFPNNLGCGSVQGPGTCHTVTAPADGFVMAIFFTNSVGFNLQLSGYVDRDPVDLVSLRNEAGETAASLGFPVRKGSVWQVQWSGVSLPKALYFLPMGQ